LKRSRGDHVIDFAQALCTITKDSIAGNAGQPLVFRDWQKELTRHLFAEKQNGLLTHGRALVGLPRKNGKSAWLASIVLEHLIFGVSGGEAYSAAADKEQSKIIFNTVRDMVKNQPELSDFLTVYKDSIYNPKMAACIALYLPRHLQKKAFPQHLLPSMSFTHNPIASFSMCFPYQWERVKKECW